jgi:hypothetical protein
MSAEGLKKPAPHGLGHLAFSLPRNEPRRKHNVGCHDGEVVLAQMKGLSYRS